MTQKDTIAWFAEATPNPTMENFRGQFAADCEEVAELYDALEAHIDKYIDQALLAGGENGALHARAWISLRVALVDAADKSRAVIDVLNNTVFKAVGIPDVSQDIDVLDACFDKRVTATGLAHCMGANVRGGVGEIDRSNFSKFDAEGKAIRNENGKIIKNPETYFKADLTPYLKAL